MPKVQVQRATNNDTPVESALRKVAAQFGVPFEVAKAIAYHESGLNPESVGDNGTSFGLFQLHEGGELGSNTEQWAFDPINNATRALAKVASTRKELPNADWGTVAATAQGPANPSAYAASINSLLRGTSIPDGSATTTSGTPGPTTQGQSGGFQNVGLLNDIENPLGSLIGSVANPLGKIDGAFKGIDAFFTTLLWFADPVNWIRISAFLSGSIAIVIALYFIYRELK